jgi:hypothetical protein
MDVTQQRIVLIGVSAIIAILVVKRNRLTNWLRAS